MQLEKIVLNGFKSFAEKTEFKFDKGITAIVGPNGCGKSNVVDAVKWVLGNQSPKSLRSGQMSDVIFSGSGSRKASGMAEVRLAFSDVSGLAIEQDNLEIARRLYRSGESEYLINNRSCRLKDIRELFMDTGVGVSAYSIIEQGQIDQLLHASKVDRRLIFEEAAGISKYKAHKKEALRKLDRTEQNLLRLADIVTEVQKQLRSVKLQAGKARNYLQHSCRLKELRVNYSLAEFDKITTMTRDKGQTLAKLKENFGGVVAEVARQDASVSELGSTIIASEGEINRCDNSLITAKSRIEQQLERIEFLKSRIEELNDRKNSSTQQVRRLNGRIGQLTGDLSQSKVELEENEKLLAAKTAELTAMEQIIRQAAGECQEIETSLSDEKSGVIDIVRRTAQLHNEIQSMSTYRGKLSGQKERLSDRATDAQGHLTTILTQKAQHKIRLNDINKVIADLQESLEAKREETVAIEDRRRNITSQLTDAREKRSGLASEHKILSDMETNREGLSGSLKNILAMRASADDDRYDYIEGIVADIIRAEPKYAIAVEAALEGRTDALVVNSTKKLLADDEMRKRLRSRVNVICTDRIEPFVDLADFSDNPAVLGRAVEFVNYDSKHAAVAWKLLGRTVLVESIEAGMKIAAKLTRKADKYTFVTPAGELFDGGHSISLGPVGKAAGLISRKSRLSELNQSIAAVSLDIETLDAKLDQSARQNDHLVRLCKDLRTSIYEANTEKVNADAMIGHIEENIKRLTDEQPVIAGEIDALDREISQSVQKEYDSKQKLSELEQINTERTSRIAELEERFTQKKAALDEQTASLTELKISAGQIAEQQNSIRQRSVSLQDQLEHTRGELETTNSDFAACDEQIAQSERDILAAQAAVSELYVEKDRAQQISTRMHEEVRQLLEEKEQTERSLRDNRVRQSDVEQKMHAVELELSQLSVKDEDLRLRVQEELQIDLVEAYESFEQEDVDWQQVREEIAELRGKIERLGNVNVDAIDQQEELEQRYEFLATQVEDLDKSKTQLEQLIGKINKESKEKFRVTFEQVRINFQELFRKLFGGGKADIFLEDPEDILDCGIEIIARPPGKETRSISLLSGGEKTLTALGLLFAVFKCKPSPFCFLDEVDAALDEANNERFNMIVQEFQKDSQFIIVTHSKRTMSIADVLFGITMQTQGVSKKISVQFDGADIETEEAAVA